ncbi:MAG: hypothetical protein KBA61_03395 [Spirochaetes bacterium]|nr:hypothetical protein [Spirochaetota bacterium]
MNTKPTYCTRPDVESCAVCSLTNYGRDCHNIPIRDEDDLDDDGGTA